MNFDFDPVLLASYGIELSEGQYLANAHRTVVVGMSGGVDSSVTALLCKLQGYRVIGLFMKNWDEVDAAGVCSADRDYQDVIKVCERLDIPYYSVNFVKEYQEQVFAEFLQDYRRGLTPNPDILCNREIKFKVFFAHARLLGADFLATGHYCQVDRSGALPRLQKGEDLNKDQTYFLYAIDRGVLEHVLFPIGHLPKPRVRELAAQFDLATSTKKDSTGICFIGERNFKNFLSQYIQTTKGDFVDLHGRVLGQHDGSCFYTIGQRKGMGVGGPGEPWFVVGKNLEQNQVILAQGQDHPALFADSLIAESLNWLVNTPQETFRCKAKVRYRQKELPCTVQIEGDLARVTFDTPQRAMTERQSVVFYLDEICLGGGIIREISPNYYRLGKSLPEIIAAQV
jgi:tRNA-uridine 2-sulfurtransferase